MPYEDQTIQAVAGEGDAFLEGRWFYQKDIEDQYVWQVPVHVSASQTDEIFLESGQSTIFVNDYHRLTTEVAVRFPKEVC